MSAHRGVQISVGQVWVTRDPVTRSPSRRVVGVVGRRVCYCSGGRQNHWCDVRAFRLWIRRYFAKATRTRRPRAMARLRAV